MRVVRGSTLADRLAELAPHDGPARAALMRHVLSACEGLAFAHDRGVVHRDLKPANLMIGAFGETQIIDWGLALAPDAPPLDGARAGTPGAMSPEQRRGEPADARSDVWSLGAILQAVAHDPPSELSAIIARAMSERPADRYPDAKALAHDLAAFLDGRRVEAHDYTPFELLVRFLRAWRGPLIVAAAAFSGLAGVPVVMFAPPRPEASSLELEVAMATATSSIASVADVAKARFLHVEKHPTAAMATRSVRRAPPESEQGYLLYADFTLHGTRRTIAVPADLAIDDCRARLTCAFTIHRSDFGVIDDGNLEALVSDDVEIRVTVDVARTNAPATCAGRPRPE